MNVLGNRIKTLRKQQKLSQSQLATELNNSFNTNIDRAMISKWETGYQTPVMNTIICLSKFFNVSIDYLNGNNPDEADNIIQPPSPENDEGQLDNELIERLCSLSEEELACVDAYVQGLLASHLN